MLLQAFHPSVSNRITRRPVLINASGDTFTPTRSGSLGPWVWEVCNAALADNVKPFVISKRGPADPFDWPDKQIVDWPPVRAGRVARFGYRAYRRLTHWPEFGMKRYADNLVAAIRDEGLDREAFFLQNDPELTVHLREKFPHARLISHFQNEMPAKGRFKASFPKAFDVATACSAFTARKIEQLYQLPPDSVVTLHSGVNAEQFSPPDRPRRDAVPVIGFIGRLGPEKGLDVLLDAALRLTADSCRFSLQLIGVASMESYVAGPYQVKIAQQISRLRAAGIEVRELGFLDRWSLPERVRDAYIHVVPSTWDEPFGLVTLEGMACGCATVASRVGGIPEIIGDAGLLFERADAAHLATHLRSLISSQELRADLARRARLRAIEFSWLRTWRQLSGLLDDSPADASQERPRSN